MISEGGTILVRALVARLPLAGKARVSKEPSGKAY